MSLMSSGSVQQLLKLCFFSSMDYCKKRLEFCEDIFGVEQVKESLTYDKGQHKRFIKFEHPYLDDQFYLFGR